MPSTIPVVAILALTVSVFAAESADETTIAPSINRSETLEERHVFPRA